MSLTESQPQPTQPTPADDSTEFLSQQADMAKAALQKVLRDAQVALAEGVDPKEWARRYPLVTLGAALAVGFTGVFLAVPSKEEQELKKLERVRQALSPKNAGHAVDGHPDGEAVKPAPTSIWSTLLKEVIAMLRPILTGLISAGMGTPHPAEHGAGDAQPPKP